MKNHRKQYIFHISFSINAVVQYFLVCSLQLQVNNSWGKGNVPIGWEGSIFFLSTSCAVQNTHPLILPRPCKRRIIGEVQIVRFIVQFAQRQMLVNANCEIKGLACFYS
jgi:hypothetical protein